MNIDNFNFQRFCIVFKRDIVENWGKDLRTYIGMFLGYFITMLILNPDNVIFEGQSDSSGFETVLMVPLALVTVLYIFVGLSGMFSNLSHKQSRISFFMLPASNIEKYLVRLLRSSVIFGAVIVVCFALADLSAYVVHYAMGGSPALLLSRILPNLEEVGELYMDVTRSSISPYIPEGLLYVNHFTSVCAWGSTYILGAAVFRKQPFILTSLCVFGVNTIIALVTVFVGIQFFDENQIETIMMNMEDWTIVTFYAMLLFNLLWTVFCFWITYRMFKKANVIAQRTIGL